jgi:hypothetical protein
VTQLQDEIASKNLEVKASSFRVHTNKIMKLPHIYTLTTFKFECMPGIVSEGNFDFVVALLLHFNEESCYRHHIVESNTAHTTNTHQFKKSMKKCSVTIVVY